MYTLTLYIVPSIVSFAYIANGAAISLSPAATAPSNATGPIDHSYLGLGIESSSFPDYSGNNSRPNNFSIQLLENLSNKTGAPIYIRVGGSSLDNATYSAAQTSEAVVYPPGQFGYNVPSGISLGPPWFEGYQTLPAKWILDVPLQFATVDESTAFAVEGLKYITSPNLFAIEIGNEPNFYTDITPQSYISRWEQYASAITSALSLPNSTIYQGLTIASGSAGPPWDVSTLFTDGANAQNNLKTVSYHYYQTSAPGPNITNTLLNHTNTVTNADVFKPDIAALAASPSTSGISFVLGEIGSSLNGRLSNGTQTNDFALESVLGAAVWTVDFLLYAASIGVDLVSMQQITGGGYSAWQPITYPTTLYGVEQPAVLPPYYGYLFVADFIGANAAKELKIVNIDLTSESLTAYAGYEGNKLTKIALINTEYWENNFTTPRPTQDFEIGLPAGVNSVLIEKLTGPGGASSNENISWAGYSYTYESGGKAILADGGSTNQTAQVSGGTVTVAVPAVEAWLLTLGQS